MIFLWLSMCSLFIGGVASQDFPLGLPYNNNNNIISSRGMSPVPTWMSIFKGSHSGQLQCNSLQQWPSLSKFILMLAKETLGTTNIMITHADPSGFPTRVADAQDPSSTEVKIQQLLAPVFAKVCQMEVELRHLRVLAATTSATTAATAPTVPPIIIHHKMDSTANRSGDLFCFDLKDLVLSLLGSGVLGSAVTVLLRFVACFLHARSILLAEAQAKGSPTSPGMVAILTLAFQLFRSINNNHSSPPADGPVAARMVPIPPISPLTLSTVCANGSSTRSHTNPPQQIHNIGNRMINDGGDTVIDIRRSADNSDGSVHRQQDHFYPPLPSSNRYATTRLTSWRLPQPGAAMPMPIASPPPSPMSSIADSSFSFHTARSSNVSSNNNNNSSNRPHPKK